MNKYLKVLIINTLLFTSFLLSYQTNISYSQSNIDELISIAQKEEYLNNRISDLDYIIQHKSKVNNTTSSILEKNVNMNILKYKQIKLFKIFFSKQLLSCEQEKEEIIKEIKKQTEETLQESRLTYIKGEWPLENYRYISSTYGYRIHPIRKQVSFHNGIDIPAPKNTSVLASDDGIVIYAGYKNGYGNVVEIQHFDSKKTLYAHNNSINVKVGDIVKRGQVISKVGSTGDSTGNHVHFEVKIDNQRINPLNGISNNI